MRLPRVAESREIFSPSSAPEWAEHLLERGEPRRQHVLHGVAARGDSVDELLDAVAQRVGHGGTARSQCLGDALAGLFEFFGDIAAAQAQVEDERLAGSLERRIDLVGAHRDRLGQLARRIDDGVAQLLGAAGNEIGDLLGAADHQVDDRQRFLGEAFSDLGRAVPSSCLRARTRSRRNPRRRGRS